MLRWAEKKRCPHLIKIPFGRARASARVQRSKANRDRIAYHITEIQSHTLFSFCLNTLLFLSSTQRHQWLPFVSLLDLICFAVFGICIIMADHYYYCYYCGCCCCFAAVIVFPAYFALWMELNLHFVSYFVIVFFNEVLTSSNQWENGHMRDVYNLYENSMNIDILCDMNILWQCIRSREKEEEWNLRAKGKQTV